MQKVGYKKGSPGITKGQKMGETLDRKREGLINRLPGISKGQFQNTDPPFYALQRFKKSHKSWSLFDFFSKAESE
jgi:hypothetical protein